MCDEAGESPSQCRSAGRTDRREQLRVAAASVRLGPESGDALAAVVGVLVEVPVMLYEFPKGLFRAI